MKLFGKLAHAHGLKVVEAPAMDLCSVSGTLLARKSGETCSHWFARVNIAGGADADGDLFILQDEANTANLSAYDSLYTTAAAQARAAHSAVKVYSEVSSENGTAAQMIAAAKSISPDGMYVAAPGAIPTADQFFKSMQASGY